MPTGAEWSGKRRISGSDGWVTVFSRFAFFFNPAECLQIRTHPGGQHWSYQVIGSSLPFLVAGEESGWGELYIGWASPWVEVKIKALPSTEWEYQTRRIP
jgi:hypothetical protein